MRFPPRGDPESTGAADTRRLFYGCGAKNLSRCILVFLTCLQAAGVSAHSPRLSTEPVSGIAIPNLSHGEMAVLDIYRSDIIGIADKIERADPFFRRLQNHAAIQYAYCFWGVAPGAITDEESPFNECSHAYLAAAKALLLHMRDMPGANPAAAQLVSKIEEDMIAIGAAFIVCRYSGESFNTAEFLTPHWENVPTHIPTMAAAAGVFLTLILSVFLGIMRSPRRESRMRQSGAS